MPDTGPSILQAESRSQMSQEVFQRIVAAVSLFDALDLLASVAAVQLLLANASRTVRLEVLAYAVAVEPSCRGVGGCRPRCTPKTGH